MTTMAFKHHVEPRGSASSHAGGALRTVPARERDWASRIYVPPGWPEGVLPPGAPDWESSAVAYLLDCCPADYRAYPVLGRHPVVLARFAAEFVESQIRASREALGKARADLSDYVGGDVLDRAVEVLQSEGARLVRVRRSVMLIEEALRGRIFIQRL
ncbi:MAG TPA: hypothetical protein PKN27_02070 [Propionibacteriaceae bacterium]|nr:hypothetical protein [Propionibacteriaceae bacterium]